MIENGWPSGFGSGAVNELGLKYQQKYLRVAVMDTEEQTDRTITNITSSDGKNQHFYFDVNPFYVDTLDGEVTDEFIKSTHEKYKSALGTDFSKMAGFFTDEPQISRNGIPWSFILEEEYKNAYNEPLLTVLPDLFFESETSNRTRYLFWKLVTRLFAENFMGKIYQWCNENNTKLTGHMVLEETFFSQLTSNGACMPNYEYMHIPGVDWLGRRVEHNLLVPQVASVAQQLGKKQVLTESFALCGWNVSFEEMKWILEWQMVKGVNLLCEHLEGYSLAGIRKRDYPAGHFYQNAWWDDYNAFSDFSARMGMLLSEGEIKVGVLVLHPQSSAWVCSGTDKQVMEKANICNRKLIELMKTLDYAQIAYHLGDERIIAKHAKVENDAFLIGEQTYRVVIVPKSLTWDEYTVSLLSDYQKNGGKLLFVEELPTTIGGERSDLYNQFASSVITDYNDIIREIPKSYQTIDLKTTSGEKAMIDATSRRFAKDGFTMYYFVNTYAPKTECVIKLAGKSAGYFDYTDGTVKKIPFQYQDGKVVLVHTFYEKGSLCLFVYEDDTFVPYEANDCKKSSVNALLKGEWKIEKTDLNAITLDTCDCYFDNQLIAKNLPVNDIQEMACELERKVAIKLDFFVSVKDIPQKELYLVCETPELFTVSINGEPIEQTLCGYYFEKSFLKIDISGKLKEGTNVITLACDFVQSKETYENLKNCKSFESYKNKLAYDMEIEAIYLVGAFSVRSESPYKSIDKRAVICDGNFSIVSPETTVIDGDITVQGFPFFNGSMTLSKEFTLTKDALKARILRFGKLCATVTKVTINGKEAGTVLWAPYEVDLDGLLLEGKNTIEITLVGNFRNLLGPHHKGEESYAVSPGFFFHHSNLWKAWDNRPWQDSYVFVEYGIFLGQE